MTEEENKLDALINKLTSFTLEKLRSEFPDTNLAIVTCYLVGDNTGVASNLDCKGAKLMLELALEAAPNTEEE